MSCGLLNHNYSHMKVLAGNVTLVLALHDLVQDTDEHSSNLCKVACVLAAAHIFFLFMLAPSYTHCTIWCPPLTTTASSSSYSTSSYE